MTGGAGATPGITSSILLSGKLKTWQHLSKKPAGRVYLHGQSSGACLALEAAAALGDKVKKMSVYEAPYDEAEGTAEKWKEYKSQYSELIAKDRRGEAVALHLKYTGAKEEMIAE